VPDGGRRSIIKQVPASGAAGHGDTRRPLPATAGHEQPRPTWFNGQDENALRADQAKLIEGE